MSYMTQGMYPLMESTSALIVTEKDKKVKAYAVPEAMGISWGMWEVPEADNDDTFNEPPRTA